MPPYDPYGLNQLPGYEEPDAEEEQSLLRRLGHAAFTPIQWLGETLGKPAAAVRGLLAGRPDQLLNLIPFSDTLGITDPSKVTSGRDLLRQYGMADQEDTWGNFLGGLGVEIATDPLNLIAPFGRTVLGKAAEKLGKLPGRTAQFTKSQFEMFPGAVQEAYKTGQSLNPEYQAILNATKRTTKGPLRIAPDVPGLHAENLIEQLAAPGGAAANPATFADAVAASRAGQSIPHGVIPNPANPLEMLISSPNKGTQLLKGGQQASELYKDIGLHQPFFMPKSVFGDLGSVQFNLRDIPGVGGALGKAGDVAGKLAELLPPGVRNIPASISEKVHGLFDKASGNRADRAAQILHAQVKQPAYEALDLGSQRSLQQFRELVEPHIQQARNGLEATLGRKPTVDELRAVENDLWKTVVGDVENYGEFNLRKAVHDLSPVGDAPAMHPAAQPIIDALQKKYDQLVAAGYDQAFLGDFSPRRMMELLGKERGLGETQADFLKRTETVKGRTVGVGRTEFLKGVPGERNTINDWVVDPELSGPNRTLDATGAEEKVYQQMKSRWDERSAWNQQLADDAPQRMMVPDDKTLRSQSKQIASWLETLPANHVEQKLPFYGNDPVGEISRYLHHVDDATAEAEMIQRGIAQGAKTKEAWKSEMIPDPGTGKMRPVHLSRELKSVKEVLEEANLKGPQAMENVARMLGVSADDLADVHITTSNANWLLRRPLKFEAPDAVKPVINALDKVTRLFKNWVTVPFPAKHARDATYAAYALARDGGLQDLPNLQKATANAWKIVNGNADDALMAEAREAAARGVALRQMGGFTEELQPGVGMVRKDRVALPPAGMEGTTVGGEAKAFAKSFLKPTELLDKGRAFQQKMEDFYRLTHYLMKKGQGFSDEMAAAHTKLYQMDFGNITAFDKNVMQRLFPFANFAKQNLLGITHDLATQPAMLANSIRVANSGRDENDFLPAWVGSGTAFPLPFAPEGKKNYLTSLGLPFEDEGMMAAVSALSGNLGQASRQLLGQTVPQIKLPLELGFGKQIFTGRDLSDIRPNAITSLGGLVPTPIARGLTELAANSPAARLFSVADKAVDPKLSIPALIANLTTGMRVSQLDPQVALEMEGAKQALDQFKSVGKAKTYETGYLPKGTQLNPDETELWALYKLLQKRRQLQAKKRHAEAGDEGALEQLQQMLQSPTWEGAGRGMTLPGL